MKKGLFIVGILTGVVFGDSIISFQDTSKDSKIESIKLAQNTTESKKDSKELPQVANGQTFIAQTSRKKPNPLKIGKKTYKWVAHPKDSKQKIAFVGIGYYTKPQIINLGNNIKIQIVQGDYIKENITIKDSNKVKPDKAAQKRIADELAEANKIYGTYDKKRYWSSEFGYPLEQVEISSPFGSARVFNNEVKSYHGGIDMRAPIGTNVLAINDGVVVLAKQRFLAGGSVIVSHGEGVFSMYYHLSEFKVKVGQKVKKGEIIALSGDTGRVSAAHLHFSMMVNGAIVDGFNFIDGVNALFK